VLTTLLLLRAGYPYVPYCSLKSSAPCAFGEEAAAGNQNALAMRAKVTAGECASDNEVIRDALRASMARDRAVDRWLEDQVGPTYDALEANPMRAVNAAQVRARLAAERRRSSARK
jgi:antitoxin ParD1/3/4